MEESMHFPSDVLFGAAVGFAVGDAVIHREMPGNVLEKLSIDPRGVSFQQQF
jgi:hypothetical protein